MDILVALLPVLGVALGLVIAGVAVRAIRENYLRKVSLSPEEIREFQIHLTEEARVASTQPLMEIDLAPYWYRSRIKEPDRRAIIHPLVDQKVFGWYEHRSGDSLTDFMDGLGRMIWNPTRRKVYVSQWVTGKSESATVIIEEVLGTLIVGDVDNSTTYGHRAGRDVFVGDRVGGDKIGRDSSGIHAGRDVVGSANEGDTDVRIAPIVTERELGQALRQLEYQAAARGEDDEVVEALRWAANSAVSGELPEARDQSRKQRILDGAGPWVRAGISAILEGVTGALAENWLVELLGG